MGALSLSPVTPNKELFRRCNSSGEDIEVCSGEVVAKPVNINPASQMDNIFLRHGPVGSTDGTAIHTDLISI